MTRFWSVDEGTRNVGLPFGSFRDRLMSGMMGMESGDGSAVVRFWALRAKCGVLAVLKMTGARGLRFIGSFLLDGVCFS